MKNLITMLILILSISSSFTQWVIPNSGNYTNLKTWCTSTDSVNVFYGTDDGKILRSSDNGVNWVQVYSNPGSQFNTSLVLGPRTYIGGKTARMATGSNGNTWYPVNGFLDTNYVYSMTAMDNVIFFGTENTIIKSNDFGFSWTVIKTVDEMNNPSVLYAKDSVLYYSSHTSNGKTYKTTDYGNTWTEIVGLKFATGFVNIGSTIYVSAKLNNIQGIYKTTDKGNTWINTWSTVITGWSKPFNYGNTIIANGVWVSTDGAQTWVQSFNQSTLNILRRKNYIFVLADDRNIYRNTFSQVIGIQQINNMVPVKNQLKQNYPNPFNPVTVIEFDVQKVQNIRLSVYDMLGKEVAVLVNEQLKPGTYKTDWNASGYATGVYFYKLITDGYTETKQMILIK